MRRLKERWRVKFDHGDYLAFEYRDNKCYIDIFSNNISYFDSKHEAMQFVKTVLNNNIVNANIVNAFTDGLFIFESVYIVVDEDIDQDE